MPQQRERRNLRRVANPYSRTLDLSARFQSKYRRPVVGHACHQKAQGQRPNRSFLQRATAATPMLPQNHNNRLISLNHRYLKSHNYQRAKSRRRLRKGHHFRRDIERLLHEQSPRSSRTRDTLYGHPPLYYLPSSPTSRQATLRARVTTSRNPSYWPIAMIVTQKMRPRSQWRRH